MAISVRYIYSACIVTSTADIRLLHDPWFTDGIYDGSWFQFPKMANPVDLIGDVDSVFVSHIHPDHYDPVFLRSYFDRYGEKPILIADHPSTHLAAKMKADGFKPTTLRTPMQVGATCIEIVPHITGSVSDIDAAMVIKSAGPDRIHCVVNANDIRFDDAMRLKLKDAAGDIDILACGYTGAGPYPQTYFDIEDPQLAAEAQAKKQRFLDGYLLLTQYMGAKVNLPFAGQYLLGGGLTRLNLFRGVADAVEVLNIDPRAIVLAEGGEIDTERLIPSDKRLTSFTSVAQLEREAEIASAEMSFERLMRAEEIGQLPLRRLLRRAARNAAAKSECIEDYFFCIALPDGSRADINARRATAENIDFVNEDAPLPSPRSVVSIDPRYLFGLLTGLYHWNNAEVGSQYQTRREPNLFNLSAQSFLNYLAV